ncbi:MAG: hypothetical protein QW812_02130 [Thermoplasmataceae archaeon]
MVNLESCIFYEKGQCYLLASYPTRCNLCFNYTSIERPPKATSRKPLYSLMDFVKASDSRDAIFPSGDLIQQTLG